MSSSAPTASLPKLICLFRRNRRGSAAIEFAMVAPVFFMLLFAILETGIMFLADQVLETVTQESARMILTGQSQTGQLTASEVSACNNPQAGALTQAEFKSCVCGEVPALLNCNNINVDVRSYSSFPALEADLPNSCEIDSNGNLVTNNVQYNTGGPGDIVMVRLFYEWPQFVTRLGFNASDLADGKRLLCATAAFKNEPYQ